MNELQPIETTDSSLPAKLDVASRALSEATDDWQRIDIRDYAKAIEAASAILKRKGIQVLAANLVQGAERAITKANPPKGRGEGRKNSGILNPTISEEPIPPATIRDLRKAHDNITDDEFEQAKEQAIETETPLTRSYLKEQSAEKKNTMHTFGKQRNNTEEWYTPSDVIEKVRAVLGDIDLDPASNPVANEVVKARHIYTKDDDGLIQKWSGTVFLNPPFGSDKISQFVEKLVDEYQSGNVSEAILLTESLSLPNWFSKAIAACNAMFITTDRFYYWNDSNETQRGWSKGCLFYFGKNRQVFYDVFKDIGTILTRYEVVAC